MQDLRPPPVGREPDTLHPPRVVADLLHLLAHSHPADQVLDTFRVRQASIAVGEVVDVKAKGGEAGGVAHGPVGLALGRDRAVGVRGRGGRCVNIVAS